MLELAYEMKKKKDEEKEEEHPKLVNRMIQSAGGGTDLFLRCQRETHCVAANDDSLVRSSACARGFQMADALDGRNGGAELEMERYNYRASEKAHEHSHWC